MSNFPFIGVYPNLVFKESELSRLRNSQTSPPGCPDQSLPPLPTEINASSSISQNNHTTSSGPTGLIVPASQPISQRPGVATTHNGSKALHSRRERIVLEKRRENEENELLSPVQGVSKGCKCPDHPNNGGEPDTVWKLCPHCKHWFCQRCMSAHGETLTQLLVWLSPNSTSQ